MGKIEQKTAGAILQTPKNIRVGDRTYKVVPPTLATLIQASKYIGDIPQVDLNTNDVLGEILAKAENMEPVGRLFAVLILGRKEPEKIKRDRLKSILDLIKGVDQEENPEEELAQYINYHLNPKQLNDLMTALLKQMQIADFFALIASLTEVNLLKATKEAMEMTAFGQPSPESQSPTT